MSSTIGTTTTTTDTSNNASPRITGILKPSSFVVEPPIPTPGTATTHGGFLADGIPRRGRRRAKQPGLRRVRSRSLGSILDEHRPTNDATNDNDGARSSSSSSSSKLSSRSNDSKTRRPQKTRSRSMSALHKKNNHQGKQQQPGNTIMAATSVFAFEQPKTESNIMQLVQELEATTTTTTTTTTTVVKPRKVRILRHRSNSCSDFSKLKLAQLETHQRESKVDIIQFWLNEREKRTYGQEEDDDDDDTNDNSEQEQENMATNRMIHNNSKARPKKVRSRSESDLRKLLLEHLPKPRQPTTANTTTIMDKMDESARTDEEQKEELDVEKHITNPQDHCDIPNDNAMEKIISNNNAPTEEPSHETNSKPDSTNENLVDATIPQGQHSGESSQENAAKNMAVPTSTNDLPKQDKEEEEEEEEEDDDDDEYNRSGSKFYIEQALPVHVMAIVEKAELCKPTN